MVKNGAPVVRTQINLNSDNATGPQKLEHGGKKDHGASAGDSRFDDERRFRRPDDFLEDDDILRHLNNREAQP